MSSLSPALKLSAYLLGRRIAGQRKRTPVAYLFNGVRLPGLPEWDREKYPFAGIFIANLNGAGDAYRLRLLDANAYYGNVWTGEFAFQADSCMTATLDSDNGVWNAPKAEAVGGYISVGEKTFWTNFDLMNADGTLYLAASDPVPVYE